MFAAAGRWLYDAAMTQTATTASHQRRTARSTAMWLRLIERPRDAVIEQMVKNHPALSREQAKADLELAGF
jgi:hypothetical protein